MKRQRLLFIDRLVFVLFAVVEVEGARGSGYDPLAVDPEFRAEPQDLTVHDRGDKDALAWLNGAGPRTVLEAADDWKAAP